MKKLAVLVGLAGLAILISVTALPVAAAPLAKPTPTPEGGSSVAPAAKADPTCPVTPFAEGVPPGPEFADSSANWWGNDALWAAGGPWVAGSDGVKAGWFRATPGKLTVTGRRLDAPGVGSLVAYVPDGYGEQGFQASGLYFPTGGCWEVTGTVGDRTMSFVLRVAPGDAPNGGYPVFDQGLSDSGQMPVFTDVDKRYLYVALPGDGDMPAVTVAVLDRATMKEVARKPWPAFCPRLLVIGANGDWICAYGDGINELVRILNVDFDNTGVPDSVGYAHGPVTGAVMTRQGLLYVMSEATQLAVVQVPQRRALLYKRLGIPPEMMAQPDQLLLSPDGRRLYVGFRRGGENAGGITPGGTEVVRVYDVTSWKVLGEFDLTSSPARRLSLSEKGDLLYSVGGKGEVSAYSALTFQLVAASP